MVFLESPEFFFSPVYFVLSALISEIYFLISSYRTGPVFGAPVFGIQAVSAEVKDLYSSCGHRGRTAPRLSPVFTPQCPPRDAALSDEGDGVSQRIRSPPGGGCIHLRPEFYFPLEVIHTYRFT